MITDDPSAAARLLTVSASYGAGGSIIAPALAKRLHLPFADRLIPAKDVPAPDAGVERLTEAERRQHARKSFLARLAHVTGGLGLPVPAAEDLADPVRERVSESIDRLVAGGGAVILGRAAAVVLAGHPRAYHVRLDGPSDRRVARATAIEKIDQATARARLEETDRARTLYVERLYGRDPADPGLYHLVLDSTVLSPGQSVDVIARCAGSFWENAPLGPTPPG
jgi:hypothetical protein